MHSMLFKLELAHANQFIYKEHAHAHGQASHEIVDE